MSSSASWFDTVGQIFHLIPDLATPEQVEASLREILDDPTLELFWWDWQRETYIDVRDGSRGTVVTAAAGRVVTLVDYESRKVGAVAHDERLLAVPEFLTSFVPTIRIAMERDRLHRDLVEKLEELKASRMRLVKIADEERRRLERNLHDGAQQRLTVALLTLRRLEQQLEADAELAPLARSTTTELEAAIADLRELARGLHPPLLTKYGLARAVRAGAARSSIPVELDLRIESGLPPEVEAAAYYVCAEAVTNTVKHAKASRAWVRMDDAGGVLTVEVRDDGIGGACIDCDGDATGLGGLKDRVEALGGTLEVVSPEQEGTRLVAVFPVA